MHKKQTFLRDTTAENLSLILCSMSKVENNQQELIFPDGMIEGICKEKQYPCYKFAHNLEGHIYMRAKINRITLEYLVITNSENQSHKEAFVTQIVNNGQRIYHRPDNPIGKIYVLKA